jgi:hypothetical protein
MKSKKNIYFLAAAVLIVWGLLGYRIFNTLSPKEIVQRANTPTKFKPAQATATKEFDVVLNYRDPFLNTAIGKPPKKKHVKATTTTPKKPFPVIQYKGVVSGKNNRHQVFLITIDGQAYFFKKNSIQKNVKLIRGTAKKITLTFDGQQQTFAIEK